MRIIPLTIVGLYLGILSAFSQTNSLPDTAYKSRKLKIDEINIVSAYYQQSGNNSAVTGGIGTEHLTDIANTIDLQMSKYGKNAYIKHHFGIEVGIDTYSSASSDKIDPTTISSASKSDIRVYPSLSWNIENEKNGSNFGVNLSFSNEYDYNSLGGGLSFSKASKDKNRELSVKLQAFLDKWSVIYPIELRNSSNINEPSLRNTFTGALSVSQVINRRLQALLMIEPSYQHGLLATKYQRVYFTDQSLQSETLPEDRYKLPIGIRLNYFAGDKVILRGFYRYYMDNWGINANTIELETPVKLTPFVSLSPFYRFYNQSQADYFAPYALHKISESYFTSDYDLSKFNSSFFGAGIRLAPPKGLLGWNRLTGFELRYGHYTRNTGLNSNILSMNLKFK
jgi:hypothetical protein